MLCLFIFVMFLRSGVMYVNIVNKLLYFIVFKRSIIRSFGWVKVVNCCFRFVNLFWLSFGINRIILINVIIFMIVIVLNEVF